MPPADPFSGPVAAAPHVPLPTDEITAISGPVIGADQMLVRINDRSRDAHALFGALRGLRLFGEGRTERRGADGGDHPLISVILEWRDRYLASAAIVATARTAIAAVDEVKIEGEEKALYVAQLVNRSVTEIARYESEINRTLDALRRAVQEALTWVQKIGMTDSMMVLEEVKRMRSELDLERKKIAAGVVTKVAETLRVSAGSLMAERRRRAGVIPAAALRVTEAGEGVGDAP